MIRTPKHLNERESVNLGAYYTPPYLVDYAYKLLKSMLVLKTTRF
ncbi:hypothetical protein UBN83_13890 [Helicobacter pylori]